MTFRKLFDMISYVEHLYFAVFVYFVLDDLSYTLACSQVAFSIYNLHENATDLNSPPLSAIPAA